MLSHTPPAKTMILQKNQKRPAKPMFARCEYIMNVYLDEHALSACTELMVNATALQDSSSSEEPALRQSLSSNERTQAHSLKLQRLLSGLKSD
jgi:hypothetical protein